jgi:MFS family permease
MAQATKAESSSPPVAAVRSRRLALTLLTVIILLYWMALYVYVPTLPNYIKTKTTDLVMVGSVLSMYGLWQGLIRFPIGLSADWLGRRMPFIMAGLFLTGLGAWIMGQAGGVGALFVGRAITGLAAGAWVPMVAAFSALFPPAEAVQASAIASVLNGSGSILGTATTGWLTELGGYRLPFLVATVTAGIALVLSLGIREAPRLPARPSLSQVGRFVVRQDVIVPSLLSAVCHYVLFAATYGFLPILARSLGMNNVGQSLLVSLNLALITIGSLTVAALNKRFSGRFLNYASFAILFLGLVVAALAGSPALLFLSQALLGLGHGIAYPVQMGLSMRHVSNTERTMAIGVFASVYALGMFAGPALSGVIANAIGIQPMFAVTGVVCLALGVIGTRFLED